MKLNPTITNKRTIEYFDTKIMALPERYPHLDFTNTMFTNSRTKIEVVCKEHGSIQVLVTDLLRKRATMGCNRCSMKLSASERMSTTPEYIAKAKSVHGDTYSYDKTVFVRSDKYLTITCPVHGDWSVRAHHHTDGRGCPKCSKLLSSANQIKPFAEMVEEARIKHGDKYEYIESTYINTITPMTMVCPIHGEFLKKPSKHLEKASVGGCQTCAMSGFDRNQPATLYYLRVDTKALPVYKIGITNRTVKLRYSAVDLLSITILHEEHFNVGADAYDKEQEILKAFASFKYTGPALLESGNTELFHSDILNKEQNNE